MKAGSSDDTEPTNAWVVPDRCDKVIITVPVNVMMVVMLIVVTIIMRTTDLSNDKLIIIIK